MANIDQVYEKLELIEVTVSEIRRWQAGLDERCLAHRQQTDELRKDVYGSNGNNSGMKSKITLLWMGEKTVVKWKTFWFSVLRGVLVTCIIGFILWLLLQYKEA